jgi:type IX secretion system PorP/SprF family membrane protein
MKKSVYFSIMLFITVTLSAQQFPFMEGYNINPFTLSPAFAGIYNSKTLFLDYRSDWSGLEGGPTTYQVSYNTGLFKKVGVGARFIYDKTDIFKQTLILGTYTYEIKLAEKHFINLGLSAGLYKNSIDLAKYFNNSDYVTDLSLISGLEKSKLKFVSDISLLYRIGNFESGILFSNLMFGSAKYNNLEVSYKPFKNYLLHAGYNFQVSERWDIKPFILWRAGEHTPGMVEMAASVTYNKRVWATALYRTAGIWGFGAGAEVFDGVLVNYSYNLSTGVALNIFGSHQVTLGFRLFKPAPKARPEQIVQQPVAAPVVPVVPVVTEKPLSKEVEPAADSLSVVSGTVTDKATGETIKSTINVLKNIEGELTTNANGNYDVKLQKGAVYQFEFIAEGYYNKKISTDLTTQNLAVINVQLEKINKPDISLGQIHFETGKSVITTYSMPVLEAFVKVLKDNPGLKFEISGHTDNVGSPEVNRKISRERAQTCVDYLISKGIAPDRLKPVGYGQEKPLVPNNTPENMAKNRRVEAKIIE